MTRFGSTASLDDHRHDHHGHDCSHEHSEHSKPDQELHDRTRFLLQSIAFAKSDNGIAILPEHSPITQLFQDYEMHETAGQRCIDGGIALKAPKDTAYYATAGVSVLNVSRHGGYREIADRKTNTIARLRDQGRLVIHEDIVRFGIHKDCGATREACQHEEAHTHVHEAAQGYQQSDFPDHDNIVDFRAISHVSKLVDVINQAFTQKRMGLTAVVEEHAMRKRFQSEHDEAGFVLDAGNNHISGLGALFKISCMGRSEDTIREEALLAAKIAVNSPRRFTKKIHLAEDSRFDTGPFLMGTLASDHPNAKSVEEMRRLMHRIQLEVRSAFPDLFQNSATFIAQIQRKTS